ncbi:MAG: sigma 54-interacting transcriptional regulator [Myxococcota bacterium]
MPNDGSPAARRDLRALGAPLTREPIVGQSPALRRVLAAADRIAPTTMSVLVTGETGTGKEGLARRLHDASGRTGPFVVVNCASLPPDLVESELFGHERGAFTGAVGTRSGLVLEASGGTLFLDEVGELPMDVQAKLLRLLQEREVLPLGGQRAVKVDVRVVAATWRDLRARVAEGAFREDLLYRLATFELALPALRERGDDVLLLARHTVDGFVRQPGIGRRTLARTAGAALRAHEWRGNVRELQAVLARAAVLGDGRTITGADIRSALPQPKAGASSVEERVLALLESAGEVAVGQVMAALRVPRTTAWRAMAALVEAGKLEAVGETKGRRYRVARPRVAAAPAGAEDPRWAKVLEIARREGKVTRARVVEVLGVSESTAGRVLVEMFSAGAVGRTGSGRACTYSPVTRSDLWLRRDPPA